MGRRGLLVLGLSMVACTGPSVETTPSPATTPSQPSTAAETMDLPAPRTTSDVSLEEALASRRSVREFTDELLTLEEISQLLWAAQGITADWGGRTAPSAGALYPLEVYVATPDGLYHYVPQGHRAEVVSSRDLREALAGAALGQTAVSDAPAVFVVAAVYARTAGKYGDRAERYVKLEAGHVGQNILLQAVALGLGAVPMGAFLDDRVRRVLNLPAEQEPLYLIPVGHPTEDAG